MRHERQPSAHNDLLNQQPPPPQPHPPQPHPPHPPHPLQPHPHPPQSHPHPPPPPLRPRVSDSELKLKEPPLVATDTKTPCVNSVTDLPVDDLFANYDIDILSLDSEPDYAEITSGEPPTSTVKEESFDVLLPPGYTCIDYSKGGKPGKVAAGAEGVLFEGGDGAPSYHVSCESTPQQQQQQQHARVAKTTSQTSAHCTTDLDEEDNIVVPDVAEGFAAADVEVGVSVDSDYAAIDFAARDESRRVKNLYAAIDFSSKKPRNTEGEELCEGDDVVADDGLYEGTYNIIPGMFETLDPRSIRVSCQNDFSLILSGGDNFSGASRIPAELASF